MPLDRPIPAFYCCYLLRSTVRPSNLYIGSTPNPIRRTKQHNGITLGGAARTSRDTLRPWEMACIVTGFPSPVSALQFEWAWQNSHLTLHIPAELRITHAKSKKQSGRPKRPKHSMSSLLSNLHLLLRVPSFSRWPLELRFFSSDVHKAWIRSVAEAAQDVRDTIPTHIDLPKPPMAESDISGDLGSARQTAALVKRKSTPLTGHGIERLTVDYASQKPHVEKSKAIFDFEREGSCAVCEKELEHQGGIYAVCPDHSCEAVSHLSCLSQHFLANETSADEALNPVVPIEGTCPVCTGKIRWVDVVKEVTLRMRGQKEVEKLLKKPRVKKPAKKTKKQLAAEAEALLTDTEEADLSDEDLEDMRGQKEVEKSLRKPRVKKPAKKTKKQLAAEAEALLTDTEETGLSDEDLEDMEVADESLIFGSQAIPAASPDDWAMSDSSDSDSNSVETGAMHRSDHKCAERSVPTEIVIRDSEDDIEISD